MIFFTTICENTFSHACIENCALWSYIPPTTFHLRRSYEAHKKQTIDLSVRHDLSTRHASLLNYHLTFLKAHDNAYLDSNTVSSSQISIIPLDWHSDGVIDLEPRFSQPLDAQQLDKFYTQSRATNYHEKVWRRWCGDWGNENDEDEIERSSVKMVQGCVAARYMTSIIGRAQNPLHVAARTDWIQCGGGGLYRQLEYDPYFSQRSSHDTYCFYRALPWPQAELPSDPRKLSRLQTKLRKTCSAEWTTTIDEAIRRSGKRPLVHLGVVIVGENEPCEHTLLRNEMAAAVPAMLNQMQQRRNWRDHLIFPVFVYAFAGKYVRVLQVHLDPLQRRLVVRKTSYIHISGPDKIDEIKLLLGWMTAMPIGQTRFDELELDPELLVDLRDDPIAPEGRAIGVVQG